MGNGDLSRPWRVHVRLAWVLFALGSSACVPGSIGSEPGATADASAGADVGERLDARVGGDTGAAVDARAELDATSPLDADPFADAGQSSDAAPFSDAAPSLDAAVGLDATAVADTGVAPPLPAWRVGLPLHTWTAIPGTAGAGGAAIDAWGALAENKATAELYVAAAGGHSDSSDNRVVSIALMNDAPTWRLRHPSSTEVAENVLYYPDGLPTSRHLYHHLHYLPGLDVVLLGGCRYGFGGGTPTGPGMDAFDLATNRWLPRGRLTDITPFEGYVVEIDGGGAAWSAVGLRFDPTTNTWTRPGTGPGLARFPQATAPARNLIFALQYGDGQGYDLNLGVVARRLDTNTGDSEVIGFAPSAALDEFVAAQPTYAGMDYDAAHDRFLFYHGGERGKVYVITPTTSATWSMSVLPTVDLPEPAPASGSGINKRFRYLPTLDGFVLLPQRTSSLYFLRTR